LYEPSQKPPPKEKKAERAELDGNREILDGKLGGRGVSGLREVEKRSVSIMRGNRGAGREPNLEGSRNQWMPGSRPGLSVPPGY